MSRKSFYEVKEDQYLLPRQITKSDGRKKLEESVRQWCAYELIRAYGFEISDLCFESPVRVGSKSYRIDILVKIRDVPLIVVECKEPSNQRHEDALDQAISYANSETIKAEFVIYTNGTVWQVQRRIHGGWVPVPDIPEEVADIPNRVLRPATKPFTHFLAVLRQLGPVLFNLDHALAGNQAGHFFSALQRFFYGANVLTHSVNDHLRTATDNLLRVISSAEDHPKYRDGKLAAAFGHFNAYFEEVGFNYEILSLNPKLPVTGHMWRLHGVISSLAEETKNLNCWDSLVLKLNLALSEYGSRQTKQDYHPISSTIHHALREFLDHALTIRFNTSLPDASDTIYMSDMREYCRLMWEERENETKISLWEFVLSWIGLGLSRLSSWKAQR